MFARRTGLADQLKLLVVYFWDLSLDQSCLGYVNYVSNRLHSSHCRKVLILLTVSQSWNLHLIPDNCVVMKIRISTAHYFDLDALC